MSARTGQWKQWGLMVEIAQGTQTISDGGWAGVRYFAKASREGAPRES